jgi:hypothetical protein
LLRCFTISKERQAFSLWKENYYENTKKIIESFEIQTFHKNDNSDILRRNVLEKRVGKLIKTSGGLRLKRYFIAMFDYKAKKIGQ